MRATASVRTSPPKGTIRVRSRLRTPDCASLGRRRSSCLRQTRIGASPPPKASVGATQRQREGHCVLLILQNNDELRRLVFLPPGVDCRDVDLCVLGLEEDEFRDQREVRLSGDPRRDPCAPSSSTASVSNARCSGWSCIADTSCVTLRPCASQAEHERMAARLPVALEESGRKRLEFEPEGVPIRTQAMIRDIRLSREAIERRIEFDGKFLALRHHAEPQRSVACRTFASELQNLHGKVEVLGVSVGCEEDRLRPTRFRLSNVAGSAGSASTTVTPQPSSVSRRAVSTSF